MGHASIATTILYLHHLGTSADRAGLDRLNVREHKGGTRRPGADESQALRHSLRPNIVPSQGRKEGSGAKGTRTPDLLVANETRYQLRHSPADRGGPISRATLPPSGRGDPARFAAFICWRWVGCRLRRVRCDRRIMPG